MADERGGAGYVFLVVGEHGISKATTDVSLAHRTADAIDGVVAELPIIADYRKAEQWPRSRTRR